MIRRWGIIAALVMGLLCTACIEHGPITILIVGDWGGMPVDPRPDAGDATVEPDEGPVIIGCDRNTDCDGVDPSGNATILCVDRRCLVTNCPDNLRDADSDPTNGCECILRGEEMPICNAVDDDCDGAVDEASDLAADVLNCGTCGNDCGEDLRVASFNVDAVICRAGVCGIETCSDRWFNPTGRFEDGCRCGVGNEHQEIPITLPDDTLEVIEPALRRSVPSDARLAYPGQGAPGLVVWNRRSDGNPHTRVIRAQRIDSNGYPLGVAHTLATHEGVRDSTLVSLHSLEPGRFAAVWSHSTEAAGRVMGRAVGAVIATYVEDRHDAPMMITPQPLLVPDGVSYVVAPTAAGMRAAYLTDPDEAMERSILEAVSSQELATVGPIGGPPRARDATLLALACNNDGTGCRVAWLTNDEPNQHLRVNSLTIDEDASPRETARLATSPDGMLLVWSTAALGEATAMAVGLSPDGNSLSSRQVVQTTPQSDAPHGGGLFADYGTGDIDAFVLSWTTPQGITELVRLDDSGVSVGAGRRTSPSLASGRVDAERYFSESPPRTFDLDGLHTGGAPWPGPARVNTPRIAVAHAIPLAQRIDAVGVWLAWTGSDGIYAGQLTDRYTQEPQVPVLLSRGTGDAPLVFVPTMDGGATAASLLNDRLRTATVTRDGAVRVTDRMLQRPPGASAFGELAGLAWGDGRLLLAVGGSIDGEPTTTVVLSETDEAGPLEIAAPDPLFGKVVAVDGPGGAAGALLLSRRANPPTAIFDVRRIDGNGQVGPRQELSRTLSPGPATVVYNPVSRHSFVLWLEPGDERCEESRLRAAVYDASLTRIVDGTELHRAAEGECLDWMAAAPNPGGGVTVLLSSSGRATVLLINTDAFLHPMGGASTSSTGNGNHSLQTTLLGTLGGAISFRVVPTNDESQRIESVRYGCD